MAKKTLAERKSEKVAELAKIKQQIALLEAKAAERIGKIAVASGLDDLGIDDATLRKEFEAVAAKFRNNEPAKDQPSEATNPATEPN